MSICITTAFKNIGRGDWEAFSRGSDTYFKGFLELVDRCPFPIFVYLEEDGRRVLKEKRPEGLRDGVTVLPMELVTDAPVYTHTERDWEVMQSPEFEKAISGLRASHPERSRKMYNTVTNSKAAFVKFTKGVAKGYDYYVWQDFGTVNLESGGVGIPTRIDEEKLSDKIMMQAFPTNWPSLRFTPLELTSRPGAGIAGGSISIPSHLVEWLAEKVEETLDLYHAQYLTNDDQSIFLTIHYANPGKFDFSIISNNWCRFWAVLNGDEPPFKLSQARGLSVLPMIG